MAGLSLGVEVYKQHLQFKLSIKVLKIYEVELG